jgi:dipeptidyl aminopeptidase/acylaminoacyl peptidase
MAKRGAIPEDLLRIVTVSDPFIDRAGRSILFTRKHYEAKFKAATHIWSVDREGRTRQWTAGDHRNWNARWSPAGDEIALLSDRAKPRTQIYRLSLHGGEAIPLTDLPEGDFASLQWSPDGRKILFSFREKHPDFTEAAAEQRKDEGRSAPPKVVETAFYRLDGDGFFLGQRHKLYVVEVETGQCRIVFEGCPVGWYSYDWAPDSSRFAVIRSMAAEPWNDPANDQIFLVDLFGNAEQVPSLPLGEKTSVRWSPDGEWLAWFGNTNPEDHRGVNNPHLFIARTDGSELTDCTPDADLNFNTYTLSDKAEAGGELLHWSADGRRLITVIGNRGETQLAEVDLEDQAVRLLTQGQHVLTLTSVSEQGDVACLVAQPHRMPEIGLVPAQADEPVRLTQFNAALCDELDLQEPEELELTAVDGYPVHAWILKPPGFDPSQRYPGVLEIHGGPHAQYGWSYFHEFQVLASAGYVVLFSNPRGSKGYGSAHVAAIAGRWGGKDWEDIRAVKDWMRSQAFIDADRLGVMGGSYGGYLVNWTVAHTDDFRAAITDRCVSNLISKSLNTDYPYHPGTYWKGAAYEEFEGIQELWRDSPIAYFHRVKTPMLIIHSEGDLRCHIEQGEQVFTALKERGVEARFVRYPSNTSHGMSRGGPVDLRIHRLHEILNWWKRWLG